MQGFVHFIATNYTIFARNRDRGLNRLPGGGWRCKTHERIKI